MSDETTLSSSIPRRILGRSRIEVTEIGVGCWAIGGADWNLGLEMGWGGADDRQSLLGLRRAFDLGVNYFDTADIYGHGHSERLLGQLIATVPRDRIVISTKFGYFRGTASNAYHPLHVRHQFEMSLCNLQTDYVDIYFFHNFHFGEHDEYLDDAIETVQRFKEKGWVRAIGMRGPHIYAPSRYSGNSQDDKYSRFYDVAARVQPDVIQVRYNMLTPLLDPAGRDIFSWADHHDIGVVVNKPLAQGLLLDKYDPQAPPRFEPGDHRARKRWFTPVALEALRPRLSPVKDRFGSDTADLVRVALQYCLHRSRNALVIPGFKTSEQIEMNVGAAARPLSEADIRFLQEVFAGVEGDIGAYFG